jgi:antitoxin component of RelBE/YafQ-DinJ toxin-antitoxin module
MILFITIQNKQLKIIKMKKVKKDVKVQVCLTEDVKNKLQQICDDKGIGLSPQINMLINDFIKNNN